MENDATENKAVLCGSIDGTISLSHLSRGKRYYTFPLRVARLSGTDDLLNVICDEELLSALEPDGSPMVRVEGELRSYNNKSGVGNRLVIFVYASAITLCAGLPENAVTLCGTVCKQPGSRITPMGREICDLLVAVNRPYGHSDYLPCIAWGQNARVATSFQVGDRIAIEGRIQSRNYIKSINGEMEHRTAYEVSASAVEKLEAQPELQ